MISLNDSGIMNEVCGNLMEGTGPEVQKTLNLLNHPTVKMEIERLVIQVIAQQYNILERLDVLEQYLGG
ncbi:MAG: hypothetical protein PHU28_03315 [Methanosarcinaceae archaeon]|nr:hypothetical protein [Methanosarcinaceae archaeon]